MKALRDLAKGVNATAKAVRGINEVARETQRTGETLKDMTGSKKTGQQQSPQGKAAGASWACPCGTSNAGKFCGECGKPQPVETACSCGWIRSPENSAMKFCGECGAKF